MDKNILQKCSILCDCKWADHEGSGISQACCIVKMYHSSPKPSMYYGGLMYSVAVGRVTPFSPTFFFFFLLSVEVLAIMVREETAVRGIKVHSIERKISQFADDTQLMNKGDRQSSEESIEILDRFDEVSGLFLDENKTLFNYTYYTVTHSIQLFRPRTTPRPPPPPQKKTPNKTNTQETNKQKQQQQQQTPPKKNIHPPPKKNKQTKNKNKTCAAAVRIGSRWTMPAHAQ